MTVNGAIGIDGLSIVICTRNRHEDVSRCVRSIARQADLDDLGIEVLIVDDGDSPPDATDEWRRTLSALPRTDFFYYKKRSAPGVWQSRYEAVGLVRYDVIVYFDDDAELDNRHYLRRLADTYASDPAIVGVGGVARGMAVGRWSVMLGVLTCQMSRSPGKLSPSGLAGSLLRWGEARTTFETEFFHGCNMSFRRFALRDMKPYPWMTGYAVGDDLFMSSLAGRYGKLVVNPQLAIVHHESPRSRDRAGRVAEATAVNHYFLLRLRGAGAIRYAALVWTLIYRLGKETLKRNPEAAAGYGRGIGFIMNPRKQSYEV